MGAFCKTCGARIAWAETKNGKQMPVDPDPVHFRIGDGKEMFWMRGGEIVRGTRDDEATHIGFISHFATCPYADLHRKGRG